MGDRVWMGEGRGVGTGVWTGVGSGVGRGMGGWMCGGFKPKAIYVALVDVLGFDKIVLATIFVSQRV